MENQLFILTGASGSGKTTLVNCLKNSGDSASLLFFHFDSIGVPSLEEMQIQFGSVEGWQRAKTKEWIEKIKNEFLPRSHVLLEGQMRIAFIQEALAEAKVLRYQIILVDCNDDIRKERLVQNRQQPDLANNQMMSWAEFLRNEARTAGVRILDTSHSSEQESAASIFKS